MPPTNHYEAYYCVAHNFYAEKQGQKQPMDVFTEKKRSKIMASIGQKDTGPELKVRSYLHSRGLRFRVNSSALPGSPDIMLPKYKAVVFVNGCFWHSHNNCSRAALPKTRTDFWRNKIERNVARDARNKAALRATGWRVLEVWTCDVSPKRLARLFRQITNA